MGLYLRASSVVRVTLWSGRLTRFELGEHDSWEFEERRGVDHFAVRQVDRTGGTVWLVADAHRAGCAQGAFIVVRRGDTTHRVGVTLVCEE